MTDGVTIPGWYPLALSADIEPGTSAGTRLNEAELVVWRDNTGAAHVWEDRCPHRGMRLSFGFVREDRLACLYHGWQFDGSGRCRLIPAHPALRVPSTIHATPYEAAERFGMVWLRIGDPAPMPPDATAAQGVRSLNLVSDASHVLAALLQSTPPLGGAFAQHPGRPLLLCASGPFRLAAAVQPLAPGQSMLHLSLLGQAEAPPLLAVSRWAEQLRDGLEQPA